MKRLHRRVSKRRSTKLDSTEQQAARYLVRLYAGDLSADEEQQILSWRAADPQHEYAFNQQQTIWLTSMQASMVPDSSRRRAPSELIAIAASIMLGVIFLVVSGLPEFAAQPAPDHTAEIESTSSESTTSQSIPNLEESRRYLMTAEGEVDTLRLSDGSQLTLNSATVVEFMFDGNERKVRLLEGEAFFDVVADPFGQRPFVITNGDRRIEVVGTRFNVRARDQRLEVAVINGQVNLYHQPGEQRSFDIQHSAPDSNSDYLQTEPMLQLTAGFYVSIDSSVVRTVPTDGKVMQLAGTRIALDEQRVLDAQRWRHGVIRLDNVPLTELVAEFNRYHSDKLRVGDEQVGKLLISGVFHLSRDEELLQALSSSLPVRVETDKNERTLHYVSQTPLVKKM